MAKYKITNAMVDAAERYLDDAKVPDDYFKMSSDQQQQARREAVRGALIEAARAAEVAWS
jgi:hypothetical protein